ncbi:apolipoprotein N-acyltransferase [Sphingomonas sp. CJ99]
MTPPPRFAPWIALAAGLVSPVGFAPLDLWPVLLVALAVWLWTLHGATTLKSALWRSWLFGVGHFTVGNNWIQHAFDFQDKMPPVLGYFAVVALALYLAVYPMLAGGLAWRFGRTGDRPGAAFVLMAAAAWIVTEWLRASLFTGYSWNPLSVAWLPVGGVAQLAAAVGSYALSGLTILAAGAALMIANGRWRLPALLTGGIALAAIAPALSPEHWMTRPTGSGGAVQTRVRVLQPNIGQESVRDPGYEERIFRTLLDMTPAQHPEPTLVVWPEGSVEYYLEDGYPDGWYYELPAGIARRRIAARLRPQDNALVGGNALLFGDDPIIDDATNSVFLIRPDGTLGARYDKAHLVPYGEYLPMRAILQPLGLSRLVMGDVDFRPGPGPANIAVPGFGLVGVQICYEIIFSGQTVGAQRPRMIVNPSLDGWFGAWGPPQHLAQARMRAIEEGLPVLRSTPNGISAVIDAHGRLIGTVPHGQRGVIDVPLPDALAPTLFSRVGNWMVLIAAGLLASLALAARRFRR